MLRVGLTGGIGAGKSTVAQRLVARGAVVVDADTLAREVVAAGSPGLAAVRAEFGDAVIGPDGALDRTALAAVVFADPAARARLEQITHPRIAARTAELFAAASVEHGPDVVVVHDVPLLVEKRMGADYHLVVVVDADVVERVRRLVAERGMTEADAAARVSAQADETARREAADVWVDNSGTPARTTALVDRLWSDRLAPFAANLAARRPAPGVSAGPDEATQRRLARRLHRALVGACPGQPAEVAWAGGELVVRVGQTRADDAPPVAEAVCAAGYAPIAPMRFASCDPGRAGTRVSVVAPTV